MKNGKGIGLSVEIGVVCVVVAFIVHWGTRAAPNVGPSDVAHHLASFALFIVSISAILLAILGALHLIWRGILRRPMRGRTVGRERSPSGRWRHFVEIGALSIVLALGTMSVTQMRTPGWWFVGYIAQWINEHNRGSLNLGVIILAPIILDATLYFAILWGGYSLWNWGRQDSAQ